MIQKHRHPNSKTFHFNTPYIGKLAARTDWVAGGNFDGYIHADVITFYEEGCVLIWEHKIVASYYDEELPEDRVIHKTTYDFSDSRGIKFLGYRGRFLGDNNEFLVLDPLDNIQATYFALLLIYEGIRGQIGEEPLTNIIKDKA